MEIWFWQVTISPHVASLAESLAKLGHSVIFLAQKEISSERRSLGWSVPDLVHVNFLFIHDIDDAVRLAQDSPLDSFHICQGIRANGLIGYAQKALMKLGRQQLVMMETVDDNGWEGVIKRIVYGFYFHRFGKRLTGVLANGKNTRDWLIKRGLSAEKVFPFAYFLPDENVRSFSKPREVLGTYRVIFVGQFIERKRLDLLISAISRIEHDAVELIVIGSGPLENELKKFAYDQLPGRVEWVGSLPINEVRVYMAQADCLVLPSRHDGWGAVVSEALMSGTPVICSDACGSAVVVEASGYGGVFKSGSVDELRSLLNSMLREGALSAVQSQKLAEWARCLGGKSGASYLTEILDAISATKEAPLPPWHSGIGVPTMPRGKPLRVLAFAGVFFPGYKGGGPIKTIKNLFEQAGKDISFRLVTSDRDLGDTKPYTSVSCGAWNKVCGASVFYSQPGMQGYRQIAGVLKEKNYDVVYLNSFFSPRFSLFPLLLSKVLRRRVVLSPRGEFSEGALSLKSLKKKLFIAVYKLLLLHRGVVFQVSSKFEERDLRKVLGSKVDVRVAENVGAQAFACTSHERVPQVLRVIFLSRITPMKNLLLALESLRNVRSSIVFDIYGPIEDENYWAQCLKVVETLPMHVQVNYQGSVNPVDVVKTMCGYDVFYLPTKGENYGHAIAEALCAGIPPLIGDTTPWRNLKEQGIGWDLPLSNPDAFSAVLNELATMPDEEYRALRARVLSWAKEKFSQRDAIEANIALFKYAYEKK